MGEWTERFYCAVFKDLKSDREGIHVSHLIYDCLRRAYYDITADVPFDLAGGMRMWFGKKVHELPVSDNSELKLEWGTYKLILTTEEEQEGVTYTQEEMKLNHNESIGVISDNEVVDKLPRELVVGDRIAKSSGAAGPTIAEIIPNVITGTVDEYQDGQFVDLKTTRNVPRGPRPHHVKQLEMYRVLLEKNGYEVEGASMLYIDVNTTEVVEFRAKFKRKTATIEKEMLAKKEKLETAVERGWLPDRKINWLCRYCNYSSRCFTEGSLKDPKREEVEAE